MVAYLLTLKGQPDNAADDMATKRTPAPAGRGVDPADLHAQVTVRPSRERGERTAELADLLRRLPRASATACSSQVTPANVKDLELKWVFQAQSLQSFSATPLVVDGVMYVTQAPNDVVALDAKTGRVFWMYHYDATPGRICCRGPVNRGVAILGDTLFMATVDAHLVAVDAKNGQLLWNDEGRRGEVGYAMTLAPLVVKDKVIVGVAGGEYGIRGFIAAYDAKTGKEAWRFYTIPGPGEPGHDTLGRRRRGSTAARRSG